MLLENFDKDYLNSISDKIEEKSKKYDELFDECCKRIEKASKSSVETFFTKGLSDLSRGFGKVIASIFIGSLYTLLSIFILSRNGTAHTSASLAKSSIISFDFSVFHFSSWSPAPIRPSSTGPSHITG